MNQAASEDSSENSTDLHFQIIAIGTVVFVLALFWFSSLPHTNTRDALISEAASRTIIGIQLVGGYLAFAVVVLSHRLCRNKTS